MAEPDELYTLRNHFWTGNYQVWFDSTIVDLYGMSFHSFDYASKLKCCTLLSPPFVSPALSNSLLSLLLFLEGNI